MRRNLRASEAVRRKCMRYCLRLWTNEDSQILNIQSVLSTIFGLNEVSLGTTLSE